MSSPASTPVDEALVRWLAVAVLVVACCAGIAFGTEETSVVRAIQNASSLDRTLLLSIRAPRVAMAALAGGGLAIVGACFQALLRNPLAEPFVLGVSGGAALGATTAIALGLGATTLLGAALVPGAALVGGLVATLLVYAIGRAARGDNVGTSMLLAGVIVNSIAAALITLLKSIVPPSRALSLLRWLMGFIDLPSAATLATVGIYVAAGSLVLLWDAARLNLLALGDESATALGVDLRAFQRRAFFASSCIVGAVVSTTGLIGFVGLIVPHVLRRLASPDHRVLLPLSFIGGASTLVLCDLVGRMAFRALHTELPVGTVTALLGGPMFLFLLRRGEVQGARQHRR